jgi:glyoxylase-like metal-dependent hydrolase (beta-lactamase superfamily II)
MTFPSYDVLSSVLPQASLLVQRNPGVMTLEGTNTWLLRDPASDRTIVVDPGQADNAPESERYPGSPKDAHADEHLAELIAAAGEVALVLVTHRHHDHYGIAAALHDATGAPVRATDPELCRGASALTDGEVFEQAGVRLRTLFTPGHTADSTSFVLEADDGTPSAVLTGDMILGHGTTVVAHPDGVLGPYLDSLRAMHALGEVTVLPGHGPVLPSLAAVTSYYLEHRQQRLEQVRAALETIGPDASARQIVEVVYADVDEALWPAAELSVKAQLDYLRP